MASEKSNTGKTGTGGAGSAAGGGTAGASAAGTSASAGPQPEKLEISTLPLGPFQTNCYVVRVPGASACVVVDASYDSEKIVALLRHDALTPTALLLTHAHMDHIAGVPALKRAFPALPVLIHSAEEEWLTDAELNLSAFSGEPVTVAPPDATFPDAGVLEFAGLRLRALHVPGHSPGSCAFHHAESGVLFGGDALFAGSVGRTDFPGCSFEQLEKSIRARLYTLPDATRVLPGHGPATTIGREKASNPFVRP